MRPLEEIFDEGLAAVARVAVLSALECQKVHAGIPSEDVLAEMSCVAARLMDDRLSQEPDATPTEHERYLRESLTHLSRTVPVWRDALTFTPTETKETSE